MLTIENGTFTSDKVILTNETDLCFHGLEEAETILANAGFEIEVVYNEPVLVKQYDGDEGEVEDMDLLFIYGASYEDVEEALSA